MMGIGVSIRAIGRLIVGTLFLSTYSLGLSFASASEQLTCHYPNGYWDDADETEQSCLQRLGGLVRRVGDLAVIRLLDGTDKTLTFEHDDNQPGSFRTRFFAYWPKEGLILFAHSLGFGAGGFAAVNISNGRQHYFDSRPIISPSGRLAVTLSGDPDHPTMTIIDMSVPYVRRKHQHILFECGTKDCCSKGILKSAQWQGETKIVFQYRSFDQNGPDAFATLERGKTGRTSTARPRLALQLSSSSRWLPPTDLVSILGFGVLPWMTSLSPTLRTTLRT